MVLPCRHVHILAFVFFCPCQHNLRQDFKGTSRSADFLHAATTAMLPGTYAAGLWKINTH
ncbi:hypothetical protein E2C01_022040 [Portunus trituberculatus]|uniref:Uncharacterized protein n=1 Tax=Portunus trituberculatus TaxID=210409 RepID=A0A5B7E5Y8_PORTR|nr:hypothetical protein [Portunus trituberculatus]